MFTSPLLLSLQVLMNVLKAKLDPHAAFMLEGANLKAQLKHAVEHSHPGSDLDLLKGIVWTKTLQRMYFLTKRYSS